MVASAGAVRRALGLRPTAAPVNLTCDLAFKLPGRCNLPTTWHLRRAFFSYGR